MKFVSLFLATAAAATVDPSLRKDLMTESTVPIFVTMHDNGFETALEMNRNARFASRGLKISSLRENLMQNALKSQVSVLDLLQRARSPLGNVQSFWITNSIYIPQATAELVAEIEKLPQVNEIYRENVIQLDPIVEHDVVAVNSSIRTTQWGIQKVGADNAWNQGITGEGIVVATIDTGARYTHEALRQNYIGFSDEKHGWYDPYTNTQMPIDSNGHGTHTTCTIAGHLGYGVAPRSKWMACRGCSTSSCSESALIACGQFIFCPHGTSGPNDHPDCSQAPHISSNSWGGGPRDFWYRRVTESWREVGIMPVFAQGNSGSRCGTANSPGDYDNVIGVGATGQDDSIAYFSSRGPARNQNGDTFIKPDVSAPGHLVASAWNSGDSHYRTISGTSMACPHTSGVIALMMSFKPEIIGDYNRIKTALTASAVQDLSFGNQACGGVSDRTFPNNVFGHGVISAPRAFDEL